MSEGPIFPRPSKIWISIEAQKSVFPYHVLLCSYYAIICKCSPFYVIRGIIWIRVLSGCIWLMTTTSYALGRALRYGRHRLGLRLPLRLLLVMLFIYIHWITFRGLPWRDIRIWLWEASTSPSASSCFLGDCLLCTRVHGTSSAALSLATPSFRCLSISSWSHHNLCIYKKSCQLLSWGTKQSGVILAVEESIRAVRSALLNHTVDMVKV